MPTAHAGCCTTVPYLLDGPLPSLSGHLECTAGRLDAHVSNRVAGFRFAVLYDDASSNIRFGLDIAGFGLLVLGEDAL